MKRVRYRRGDGGRSAAVAYCVCAVYVNCIASLLCWAVLPWIAGFTPTLIASGSMAPRINTGDVVLVGPAPAELPQGSVVTFDDPAQPERLLTHRLVSRNPDGTYRTKGDANAHPDSSPVETRQVRGVGRAVIPAVGLPMMWVRSGNWIPLLLWVVGTLLAAAYLRAYGHRLPVISSWSCSFDDRAPRRASRRDPSEEPRRGSWESPLRHGRRLGVAATAVVVALAVFALVLPRVATSHAAWADTTRNPDNQWAAATSFCTQTGTQTVTPAADTEIRADGTLSAGTNPALNVRSKNKGDIRSLLRFDLPAAANCTVTAKLRLNLSVANTARVLQVFNAPAAWAEGTATWASMPAPSATPVSDVTPALGWIEIPVTDHVLAMYSGTNHGFLLKDQAEGAGGNNANTQTFASRNATDTTLWPQLVLTFGATAAKPPAPTGLTATALSASRIALSWTDTASDETSYTVQRSPGGAATWTTVATLAANATSYTDTSLAAETTYDYRVRSTNAQGSSAWSNIASATTAALPTTPPAAPSGLTATTFSVSRVDLSWTDNSGDEDGFTVEQSPAGTATWTQAGTVGAGVTAFSATGLIAGTAYDFRVRATNNVGGSEWSNVATATTATCATLATQTLLSEADTLIFEGTYAGTNFGTDPTNFGVRALTGGNAHSLVRFPAPTVQGGCSVASATLRLRATATVSGRILQVFKVDASWTETTVTWNTRPTSSGTAATVTTDGVLGWRQWDVTHLVGTSGAGAAHGFLVRDAAEAATATDNAFSPREGTYRPELVITFG